MLLATVEDLRRALTGAGVRSVQPVGPHGLWLELATPSGEDCLLISAGDDLPRFSRGAHRPSKREPLSPLAAVARRVLPGTTLGAVVHRGLDRVVLLECAYPVPAGGAGCRVIAELFGRHPNLVLVDALTGEILEAARHLVAAGERSIGPGQTYLPPPPSIRPDPRLLQSVEAVAAVLAPRLDAGLAPAIVLRQAFSGLTELWVQEVAARTGNGNATELAGALLGLIRTIEVGPWTPHLLLDGAGRPIGASPIRLRHLPEAQQQPLASFGEATERLARHLRQQQEIAERQTALRQVLRRLEIRLRSRRAKLAAESLEFARADTWRRMGEVLVAHQGEAPRGASEVTLPDHAGGPGTTITIPLDPTLPAAANAERFFKLARRGRRGAVRVETRLADTDAELGRVHAWMKRLADAATPEDLAAVLREMQQIPRLLAPQDRATLAGAGLLQPDVTPRRGKGLASPPKGSHPASGRGGGREPRRFVSSDGFPILVGRDNAGNDYLTLHLARSEDLWLHVQGFSGSHVVVRVQNHKGGVPRRTLIQAAQLAAYYSQARNNGKVAVDYTLRKYVRKPRKSKPGLVTITQEKTIIVTPDKSLVEKLAAPADSG